jgi:hypothetical protein
VLHGGASGGGARASVAAAAVRVGGQRGLGILFVGRRGTLGVRARRESLIGDLGRRCASGKKGRRGRTEKLTGGDRLRDREKGGGAARAGAEGAGPGWLLGRGERKRKEAAGGLLG